MIIKQVKQKPGQQESDSVQFYLYSIFNFVHCHKAASHKYINSSYLKFIRNMYL